MALLFSDPKWAALSGLSQGLLQAGAPRVGAPGPNPWAAGLQGATQGAQNYQTQQQQQQEAQMRQRIAELQAQKMTGELKFAEQNPALVYGGAGAARKFGMTPVWGKDEGGNPVLLQMSNTGGVEQVDLPEGITPERGGITKVDAGDKWILYDASGAQIGTQPKTLAPGELPTTRGAQAEATAAGSEMGAQNTQQFFAASNAVNQIEDINALVEHIKTSDAITGLGAEMFKNIERAKATIGSKVAAGKATDTEILDVMMGKEVFPMIKALGVGARGMDTPAEREFMRSVLTGSISLNKNTLLKMAEIRKNVAERAIKKWNERLEKGELDRFYETQGLPKEKFTLPGTGGSGTSGQPKRRVYNPDTGMLE